MTTQSNVSLIARGIYEVRDGTAIAEGGLAMMAEGIVDAWRSPMRWAYGNGDNEVSGVSCIAEMFVPHTGPNGKDDSSAFKRAMYVSVAENYGIDGGFAHADTKAFKHAHMIAGAVFAGAPVEFVDTKVKRKGKDVKVRAVQVPASVAFKLTGEDGKLTEVGQRAVDSVKGMLRFNRQAVPDDAELLERASAMLVDCAGGKDEVFGKVPASTTIAEILRPLAVKAGYMDEAKPRNSSPRVAKFGESLEYVAKCLDLLASDSGESEFAPCNALETKMREVAERIAAYFAE
jgi:hypothetical protein